MKLTTENKVFIISVII